MSELGRCKDCAHWDRSYAMGDVRTFLPKGGPDFHAHGRCELACSQTDPCHPESLAMAMDSEGYSAWLLTAPEFGCVQFQSREAEKPHGEPPVVLCQQCGTEKVWMTDPIDCRFRVLLCPSLECVRIWIGEQQQALDKADQAWVKGGLDEEFVL